jgi:3-(3-hydroxy-phenyl)propionate hydroxylase
LINDKFGNAHVAERTGASVIIAGAGPSGCVLAYCLAQAGVEVLLLESAATCVEDMRASTLHVPTLEMLHELGLLPELEAQGLRAPVYQYMNRRSGARVALDLTEIADLTAFPYRLQCEQFKLTRLIVARLAGHPHAEVRFNQRVVAFDQDEAGVTVHVETPFDLQTHRCDFLIGADGANSIVRKWMGVEFEGFTFQEKFLTLSTAFPLDEALGSLTKVNYVADETEWCVLLRVPDFWRILVPADADAERGDLLSDRKKAEVFSGLGVDGASVVTHHRTVYQVHQRVADRYVAGRVMLIGDAAHLNNPLGGFGMNSGIHDAWNLSGKLVEILRRGADRDAALGLFERQRQTIMREFVQKQSIQNKAALEDPTGPNSMEARLRAIAADDDLRREYLIGQSMIAARRREEEIR